MAYPAPLTKTFVLRARRETVLLVATATAMTFALSSVVHSHRSGIQAEPSPPQQAWAGELAQVAPQRVAPTGILPMTSASLVVSTSELALPRAPVRPLVKLHGCDGSLCSARPSSAPTPARRPATQDTALVTQPGKAAPSRRKPSLISRLNPFNHLPDAAALKRPFSVASDTVSGWFKRF